MPDSARHGPARAGSSPDGMQIGQVRPTLRAPVPARGSASACAGPRPWVFVALPGSCSGALALDVWCCRSVPPRRPWFHRDEPANSASARRARSPSPATAPSGRACPARAVRSQAVGRVHRLSVRNPGRRGCALCPVTESPERPPGRRDHDTNRFERDRGPARGRWKDDRSRSAQSGERRAGGPPRRPLSPSREQASVVFPPRWVDRGAAPFPPHEITAKDDKAPIAPWPDPFGPAR